MSNITISPDLTMELQGIALGVIYCEVDISPASKELDNAISKQSSKLKSCFTLETVTDIPEITATRNAYKRLGKSPNRYRPSAEILIRKIMQNEPIESVNNLVDSNHLISLISRMPVSCFDLEQIDGNLVFDFGRPGETFEGPDGKPVNLENLPLFRDEKAPVGSPSNQGKHGLPCDQTTHAVTVVYSFCGANALEKQMANATSILQTHANAVIKEAKIITAENKK